MNVVDAVLFQCKLQPPAPAMCAPGKGLGLVSYGRLARFIYNIARRARGVGLTRGDVVAIFIDDPILHSAFILGLTYAGIVTLSGRSAELPKELKINAAVSDSARPFTGNPGMTIVVDRSWTEGDDAPFQFPNAERGTDSELCRVALTSGTTGEARACGFTHDNLARRIARYDWLYGSTFPKCSRIFIDPGLATALGHHFWLHTLQRGGMVLFRGQEAGETLQAFGLYGVQAMIAAPAALGEFLDLCERHPAFSPKLDLIWTGGSPMTRTLAERVRSTLCSNVICNYGSTETNTVASAPSHTLRMPGAVGYVAPDAAIEIVDARGNPLPPEKEGVVRVRSAVATEGYLGDQTESEKAFRSGWFYPGDTGMLTPDGMLVISGREAAVLNLGGDKVNPERIEEVLTSFPGVNRAAAFTVVNGRGTVELYAAVVTDAFAERPLRAHCQRHLPPEHVPMHFLRTAELPLNQMGKIERGRLAHLLARE